MREMSKQAEEFKPGHIAMQSAEIANELAARLSWKLQIGSGQRAYAEMAAMPEADMVVSAQSGGMGLCATLAGVLAGKTVCLANKESLVLAGPLVREICATSHASILPIDSEHNAIAGRGQNIKKIIITASGGPFYKKKMEDLAKITPKDALAHPTWKMGQKISIDSSTMMNKALELIEAVQLFGVDKERIEILIQPQSIVHSMVEFVDGSILAQLGMPDMRLPIAFSKCGAPRYWRAGPGKSWQAGICQAGCESFPRAFAGAAGLAGPGKRRLAIRLRNPECRQ